MVNKSQLPSSYTPLTDYEMETIREDVYIDFPPVDYCDF